MGRTPSLGFHAGTGQWRWRFKGKAFYGGTDEAEARRRFDAFFREVRSIEAARNVMGAASVAEAAPEADAPPVSDGPPARSTRRDPKPDSEPVSPTVRETAEHFFAWADPRRGPRTAKANRERLRRFLDRFGNRPVASLTAQDVVTWAGGLKREDGKPFRPFGWNCQTTAVRRLLLWAYEAGLIEKPLRLGTLKPRPLPPPEPKALPVERVRGAIESLYGLSPQLGKLYLLAYWGVLRPSEIGRVVARDWEATDEKGARLPEGAFRLRVSKTRYRIVLLTPEALALLATIETDGYGVRHESQLNHAVQRARRWLPDLPPLHPMRHSAATAMTDHGVNRDHVEASLGHSLPHRGTYAGHPLALARESMRLLAQLVPEPIGVEVRTPQQRKWAEVKAAGKPRRKGAKVPGATRAA